MQTLSVFSLFSTCVLVNVTLASNFFYTDFQPGLWGAHVYPSWLSPMLCIHIQWMCILLTTETWAGSLKGPRWRFARAIHIDPPEGHPQPLPLGKSAFKSTLCQPPTPQPSEKVAFKKLFRQCLNLFPRSQQLFSFLPSFLSHFPAISSQVLDSSSPTTKSPPLGHRGRSGSTMSWGRALWQDALQQVTVLHNFPLCSP